MGPRGRLSGGGVSPPIGERRATEKAEESETDAGSQDLWSELGGITGGLWRLGRARRGVY